MDTLWYPYSACHILRTCTTLLLVLMVSATALERHQHDRSIDKVHGPLCYNCHGVSRPNACTDIKICSVGEVCMLHGIMSRTGDHSYEASCQSETMCNMIGQMQMAQIGKRADTPCHVCCSTDFCNNDCAANTHPVTPTGPVDNRLLCYSCSLIEDPSGCRHHTTCAIDQMCIIRETGSSIFGATQYQSACANKDVCNALQSIRATGTDHSFCFTCCDSDLCNNHCDYHTDVTSPTTSSTTTKAKTTPMAPTRPPTNPPTTIQIGPRCWSCDNMKSPTDCNHMVTCSAGEVCTLDEAVGSSGNTQYYKSSCELKNLCEAMQQLMNSHFGAGHYCKACCGTDGCNDVCPLAPPTHSQTTPSPTTPTTASHNTGHLRCFKCESVIDPSRCQNTEMCGPGEVCMLHELIQQGQRTHMYTASCRKPSLCQHIGELMKNDDMRTGHVSCHMCCTTDLCNRACPSLSGATTVMPQNPTTPPPKMTTTTHITAPILICYSCSVLDDPSTCHHTVPCLPGEVCSVHQIGNQASKAQYTASCESKQLCSMYSSLAKQSQTGCHMCCESHRCNSHCDPQPTTPGPTHPPTTPTTTGNHAGHDYLECYSCPLVQDPNRCPNTKICDAGEVCMLHEKTHTPGGVTYYEASCQGRIQCENVVRVVTSGSIGHGHVFCTYCCSTSRCNNHCEMTSHTTSHTTSLPSVNGAWSTWSHWSSCTVSCGSGLETRSRTCTNPAPSNHGHACQGDTIQRKTCALSLCPVDGHWSDWLGWSVCTKTCGPGLILRVRTCDNPAPDYGGSTCPGSSIEQHACHQRDCPVNGEWSLWSDWTSCSATCGDGHVARQRSCDHPAPQHGGNYCTGTSYEQKHCNVKDCPVNGQWSDWSQWGSCSPTCGDGHQTRTRLCSNPAPAHGGNVCQGSHVQHKPCNLASCPVDGGWSTWSSWSSCTATCGHGVRTRSRTCDNPAPQHHGAACLGAYNQQTSCVLPTCTSKPLECYSCDLINKPNGCPSTQICDPGQVCMLHEKSSSMPGSRYYEASCKNRLVCESVTKAVHSAGHGQGHVFCTYCCNTSRCNNHCDMASTHVITTTTLMTPPTTPSSPGEQCKQSSYNFVQSVGLCFKIFELFNTYSGAIHTCQQAMGTLAIIRTEIDWKLVSFELTLLTRVSGETFYVGGYDVFHNGSYYWPDGSAMTYGHWASGEPQPMKHGEHMPCVVVDFASMAWRTDSCSSQRPFICTKHVH